MDDDGGSLRQTPRRTRLAMNQCSAPWPPRFRSIGLGQPQLREHLAGACGATADAKRTPAPRTRMRERRCYKYTSDPLRHCPCTGVPASRYPFRRARSSSGDRAALERRRNRSSACRVDAARAVGGSCMRAARAPLRLGRCAGSGRRLGAMWGTAREPPSATVRATLERPPLGFVAPLGWRSCALLGHTSHNEVWSCR